MATMKDVARLAGVSTSTVSHVVNNTRFVSDEIRERILKAVAELNYAPSALARSLKMNQTRTFGMVMTTSNNPFYAELVSEVERICYENGYSLLLCNTEGNEVRLQNALDMMLQKRVDGLLLLCSEFNHLSDLVLDKYPSVSLVVMDWGPSHKNADRIQDNSYLGGYLATQYLIKQGHQTIGCITGPLDKLPSQTRLQGYLEAMKDAGLSVDDRWIVTGDFEFSGGLQAMKELLRVSPRPTAVFTGNDAAAFGAYQAVYQAGLQIPQDISMVGYDDIELARFMTPPLTTVHQPLERLCQQAIQALLQRIQHENSESRTITLEPELVIRDSVAVRS